MKINDHGRGENKGIKTTERMGREKGSGIKLKVDIGVGIGIVILFKKTLVTKRAKRIGGDGYSNSNGAITLVAEERLVDGGGHGGGGHRKQPKKSGEKKRNYDRELEETRRRMVLQWAKRKNGAQTI